MRGPKLNPVPIAVVCSDIHFSEHPPVARSAEPDWFVAQERAWRYVVKTAECLGVDIIIAGDIFDRWKSSPALINFVMDLFHIEPHIFAIPGQHDLPNHNLNEIQRSAYWTLVKGRRIINLEKNKGIHFNERYVVWGHPFGTEVEPLRDDMKDVFHLGVFHEYIHNGRDCYPGAPESTHFSKRRKSLKDFNAVVFGDNHKGWLGKIHRESNQNLLNCGCLIQRKSDEKNYNPRFGILYGNGEFEVVHIDTRENKWIEATELIQKIERAEDSNFVQSLMRLGADRIDYIDAVKQYMEGLKTDSQVRSIVTEVLEEE